MMAMNRSELFVLGKVPSHKEFLAVSVPSGLRVLLEAWLDELTVSHEESDSCPFGLHASWRFMVPSETRLCSSLLGVIRGSRDAVGRIYPLVIGMAAHTQPAFELALRAETAGWYDRLADLADAAINNALPVDQIALHLQRSPYFDLDASSDDLGGIGKIVSAWHSGSMGAAFATLHGGHPLAALRSGIATLGMERLCQHHSLWWRPAVVGGAFDFFHVNGIPGRSDFLASGGR